MPVNIPYRPEDPHLGGVAQDLYHGERAFSKLNATG